MRTHSIFSMNLSKLNVLFFFFIDAFIESEKKNNIYFTQQQLS